MFNIFHSKSYNNRGTFCEITRESSDRLFK